MITPSFGLTATERVLPKMALDFTTASLDARVTFTRALNTATRVNASGLIETINADLPRFDYDPVTLLCKGLLIEESRSNTVAYSNDFSDASWTKGFTTLGSTAVVAPDGVVNSVQVIETTANNIHGLYNAVGSRPTVTAGVTYTMSIYVKKGVGSSAPDIVQLTHNGTSFGTAQYANFNISTGQVTVSTGGTADIKAAGNGWYRISFAAACTTTGANGLVQLLLVNNNPNAARSPLYVGNVNSDVLVYGAQLEAGAFPTSYIPTTTTALTRNADVATMTGTNFSDWFNASEGALFAEASQPVIFATSKQAASLNDGTSTNRIMLYRQAAGSINGIVIPSGQVFLSSGVTAAANTTWKQMFAYTTVRGTYAANGVLGTDVLYPIPSSVLNTLTIGAGYPGSNDFLNGHIKKIMYYQIKLTNAEVVAFTKL